MVSTCRNGLNPLFLCCGEMMRKKGEGKAVLCVFSLCWIYEWLSRSVKCKGTKVTFFISHDMRVLNIFPLLAIMICQKWQWGPEEKFCCCWMPNTQTSNHEGLHYPIPFNGVGEGLPTLHGEVLGMIQPYLNVVLKSTHLLERPTKSG